MDLGGTAECNKTIYQSNLTVLLMYETTSLKKVGKSYWQLFNFGNEWVSKIKVKGTIHKHCIIVEKANKVSRTLHRYKKGQNHSWIIGMEISEWTHVQINLDADDYYKYIYTYVYVT